MSMPIPSNNRTKIGNGTRLFPRPKFGGPDMRLRDGRRLAEILAETLDELGRQPRASEQTDIQLAVSTRIKIEWAAATLAAGGRVDAEELRALELISRGARSRLGLGGPPTDDATPSIAQIIQRDRAP
jgi:hypothetical protein